jgi:hypothetical protein
MPNNDNLPANAHAQINSLLDETKKIDQEFDDGKEESNNSLKEVDQKIDESIAKAEKTLIELDQIDSVAEAELDTIILNQINDQTKT